MGTSLRMKLNLGLIIIKSCKDPDLERQIQKLPDEVYNDKLVQLALRFRKITTQNNVVERGVTNLVGALNLYTEFFRLVYSEETPFLMACLLETHFNEIRFYALKAISRSFHTKTKPYAIQRLQQVLGFDSDRNYKNFSVTMISILSTLMAKYWLIYSIKRN